MLLDLDALSYSGKLGQRKEQGGNTRWAAAHYICRSARTMPPPRRARSSGSAFSNGQELCLLYFNEEERSLKVQEQKEKLLMVRNWSDFCFNVLLAKQLNRNPFLLPHEFEIQMQFKREPNVYTLSHSIYLCSCRSAKKCTVKTNQELFWLLNERCEMTSFFLIAHPACSAGRLAGGGTQVGRRSADAAGLSSRRLPVPARRQMKHGAWTQMVYRGPGG